MEPDEHLTNKQHIHTLWQRVNQASPTESAALHRLSLADNVQWHGSHPINALTGADAVIQQFWAPLKAAMPDIRRNHYILMGGEFDSGAWVTATGYYHGTFKADWLGFPVSGKPVNLRFGEFCKIQDGKITEVYMILDFVDMLRQAGVNVLPWEPAERGYVPGPLAGDGIVLEPQDADVSASSLQLVYDMIYNGLSLYDQKTLASTRVRDYWQPNMLWYGPAGIGTTRGITGFEDLHQRPFLEAFPDRKGGNHKARFADGLYAASTGWPSVIGTHVGTYLGHASTNKSFGMRVMDWWRVSDGLLYENWVLLDLPHTFLQLDKDVFAGFDLTV